MCKKTQVLIKIIIVSISEMTLQAKLSTVFQASSETFRLLFFPDQVTRDIISIQIRQRKVKNEHA